MLSSSKELTFCLLLRNSRQDSTYDTADHTGSKDAGSEGCASDGDEVEEGEEVDEEERDGEGDWGGDAEHSEYEEVRKIHA